MDSNDTWHSEPRDHVDPESDNVDGTNGTYTGSDPQTVRPTELAAIDRLKQEIEQTERRYGAALSDMRDQLQSLQDRAQAETRPPQTTSTRVMDDLRARMAALAERIESADTHADPAPSLNPSADNSDCEVSDPPLGCGRVRVEPVRGWSASPASTVFDEVDEQDKPTIVPLVDTSSFAAAADLGGESPTSPDLNVPAFAVETDVESSDDGVPAFAINTDPGSSEEDAPAFAIETDLGSSDDGVPAFAVHTDPQPSDERAPAFDIGTPSEPSDAVPAGFEAFLPARNPGRRKSDSQPGQPASVQPDKEPAKLEAIEQQLQQLSMRFGHVETAFCRIEAVEANVDRLGTLLERDQDAITTAIDTAVERGFSARQDVTHDATLGRLETLEREIRTLGHHAKESDERTVDTLEAIHDALKQIVTRLEDIETPEAVETAAPAPADHPAHEADNGFVEPAGEPFAPDRGYAEVRISRSAEPVEDQGPGEPHPPTEQGEPEAYPEATSQTELRRREGRDNDEGQPREGQDEMIAEARRAAQAAARTEIDQPRRAPRFSSAQVASRVQQHDTGGRKRPILVGAAIVLLVVSAGLLYTKIRTQQSANVLGATDAVKPLPKPATDPRSQRGGVAPMVPTTPGEQGALRPSTQQSSEATKSALHGDSIATTGDVVEKVIADVPAEQSDRTDSPAQPAAFTPEEQDKEYMLGPGMMVDTRLLARKDPKALKTPRTFQAAATPTAPTITQIKAKPSGDRPSAKRMPPMEIGPASLRHAAAKGSAEAQYEVGLRFAKGKGVKRDYAEAARWLQRSASQGLPPAQYRLATLYERGRGVERDLAQARIWYERAANQGNVKAMHNLAVLHTGRTGDAPDYDTASKWFLSAALHGLADSQFNLGVLYEHGLGMKRNLVQAYKWFTLAADQGDNEAVKRKALVRDQISSEAARAVEQAVRQFRSKQSPSEANVVTWPSNGWQGAAGGQSVKEAQALLAKLGYEPGPADGHMGPKTNAAIAAFEKRTGLPATGRVTERLMSELASATR